MRAPDRPVLPRLRFGRYDYGSFAGMACYAACSLSVPLLLSSMGPALGFSVDDTPDGDATQRSLGGFLQMGRSVAMVASMLLCGLAAARWGMTRTLAGSLACMGAGIALCAVSPFYGLALAAMAVAGLGEGVLEGLLTPFVRELHPEESGRYLNFAHSFWSVGTLAAALSIGLLMETPLSWRWILGGVAALSIVPILLLAWPTRRARAAVATARAGGVATVSARGVARPRPTAADVGRQTLAVLRRRYFWLFFAAMFFAGGGEFGLTFWIPNFVTNVLGGTPRQLGFATASFGAGMILGRMGAGMLVRQARLRRLLLLSSAGAGVLALLIPGVAPGAPFGAFCAVVGLAGLGAAPLWPSIQSYAGDRLPELDKTMLFVLLSCAGIPGCGFHSWFIGWLSDHVGLRAAFLAPPAAFAVVAVLLVVDRVRFHREKRARAAAAGA